MHGINLLRLFHKAFWFEKPGNSKVTPRIRVAKIILERKALFGAPFIVHTQTPSWM